MHGVPILPGLPLPPPGVFEKLNKTIVHTLPGLPILPPELLEKLNHTKPGLVGHNLPGLPVDDVLQKLDETWFPHGRPPPGLVKPNNKEHGLIGQQYTHKGSQLGTWLRPVCHFSFDGFFRTYSIDNLESDNNVDKLKKKLGKFVTDFSYQPEASDWMHSSGLKNGPKRWMLTFKVDDTKNVKKIQQDIEKLLSNGKKVPCDMYS